MEEKTKNGPELFPVGPRKEPAHVCLVKTEKIKLLRAVALISSKGCLIMAAALAVLALLLPVVIRPTCSLTWCCELLLVLAGAAVYAHLYISENI